MNRLANQRIDDRRLIHSGFRYAISLTHNRHDAEDLIQQACLKVLRSRGSLVGKSYLFTAVRNLFYDGLRKDHSHSTTGINADSIRDESASHIHAVDQKIDIELILGCLRPEEREVLFLNCVEGYTADEIGTLTEVPRGTVLSLLSRAKKRLNNRYDPNQMMRTK
ncbi:MAG: RNA polymerase sigma factor [Planctomycetes bacterium]|nr:RNA polymerase sigma factor [Planctomycetota bacterium]MCH9725388.1 RNA polymerase sigma factor [Planctomycetota bacterium]MCH9775246.1 RNA polymerase sigma factor [Planctomycetota bacterium]MCH9791163.1 RNA polymerase sigma factor [Planctomycetota bacterium]